MTKESLPKGCRLGEERPALAVLGSRDESALVHGAGRGVGRVDGRSTSGKYRMGSHDGDSR